MFALVLWIAGLGVLVFDRYYAQSDSVTFRDESIHVESNDEEIQIVALGDSLTRGTGDSFGKGYVGYFMDSLKEESDKDIKITNLAIKGLRSPQLLELVQQQEVQRQIGQASIILLTIGGNDLFQSGETLFDYNEKRVGEIQQLFLQNLNSIMTSIRSVNKEAPIYFIGLYNPFMDLEDEETTSKTVFQWNYETVNVLSPFSKTVFVPTYDLFQLRYNQLLYTDHFHPNSEGYRLIAERLMGLISLEEDE